MCPAVMVLEYFPKLIEKPYRNHMIPGNSSIHNHLKLEKTKMSLVDEWTNPGMSTQEYYSVMKRNKLLRNGKF